MKKMIFTAALCALAGMVFAAPGDTLAKAGKDAANGYEKVYAFNPFQAKKLTLDNSAKFKGQKIKRVAYFMYLKGKDNKESWVLVSMDPFTQDISQIGLPDKAVFQTYVTNLEVKTNVPGVKTGKIAKGNIEFWNKDYGAKNIKKIPGASDKGYDFGDLVANGGNYGSMQIHNFTDKQTIFALNAWRAGHNCDLGIGNAKGAHSDWTFSQSGKNLADAEIIVLIQK